MIIRQTLLQLCYNRCRFCQCRWSVLSFPLPPVLMLFQLLKTHRPVCPFFLTLPPAYLLTDVTTCHSHCSFCRNTTSRKGVRPRTSAASWRNCSTAKPGRQLGHRPHRPLPQPPSFHCGGSSCYESLPHDSAVETLVAGSGIGWVASEQK